jgi:hypothetical protein
MNGTAIERLLDAMELFKDQLSFQPNLPPETTKLSRRLVQQSFMALSCLVFKSRAHELAPLSHPLSSDNAKTHD